VARRVARVRGRLVRSLITARNELEWLARLDGVRTRNPFAPGARPGPSQALWASSAGFDG
jgi:hypothetical protein